MNNDRSEEDLSDQEIVKRLEHGLQRSLVMRPRHTPAKNPRQEKA